MYITLERILDLLNEKNIKKSEFCNAIGIKNSLLSDWISGRIKSYNKYIEKIADYLEVSVDYLLGKTDIPDKKHYEYLDKGNIAFYQGYKGLSDEGKEKLDAFLKFLIEDEKKNK